MSFFQILDGFAATWGSNKPLQALTAVFIAAFSIFFASKIARGFRKPPFPLPPGPRGLPIIGYLPFLGTDLHVALANLASSYGPVFKLRLGTKLCVVVSSPAAVKEIVRDKDAIFANRDASVGALIATYGGHDIAFADYDPEWRKMRKLFVQEMLSKASIDACYDKRREGVRMGIREVYGKTGEAVNISQILLVTLVDSVVRTLWGGSILEDHKDSSVKGPELKQMLNEFITLLGCPNISDFFPALAWLDLQGVARRMRKVCAQIDSILDKAINERTTAGVNGSRRRDMLQYLLDLNDSEDPASSLSMNQVKALLKDIVIGGTDTTATITEWALSKLLKHPETLEQVYQELNQVVGLDSMVEESHLPQLHYLNAVLKETHRLHPALPLLVPRRPSQTTDVCGYTIPQGTKILINVWAIHRDAQLWDMPSEFRPERFLDPAAKWDYAGNDFRYLPFGSGRRVCAGLPLAERMQMYALASFLHCFKWEVPKGEEIELSETFGIVLKKAVPLVAVPTPRLSDLKLYA
uniref:Uncharacterized protein n=1 Tax=Kalanchoe fedtschenkoi TaxID=63787 RepID=A0A7N0V7D7_KALFE